MAHDKTTTSAGGLRATRWKAIAIVPEQATRRRAATVDHENVAT